MKFEQTGRIFVVYDWETQSVYDWIYCDRFCCANFNLLKIGEPAEYYYKVWGINEIISLSPDKTTLNIKQNESDVIPAFLNDISWSKYGVAIKPAVQWTNVYLYNPLTKNFNDSFFIKNDGIAQSYVSDVNGNIWGEITNDSYYEIIKIQGESNDYKTVLHKIEPLKKGRRIGWWVLRIEDDIGFVARAESEIEFGGGEKKFEIYSFNPNEEYTGTSELCKFEFCGNSVLNDLLVEKIIFVNGKYYFIGMSGYLISESEYIKVFEMDVDKKEYKLISSEKFYFSVDTGIKAYGNRIYLFDAWDKLNVKMVYFDTETNQFSQVYTISYPDVIRK